MVLHPLLSFIRSVLLCGIIGTVLLSACIHSETEMGVSDKALSGFGAEDCIPPMVKFAFPYRATADQNYPPTPVPISTKWEPQLSEKQVEEGFLIRRLKIIVRRKIFTCAWISTGLILYSKLLRPLMV